ncbi:MAG: hypothetical protein N2557_07975 [Hydrogenophilus sp.]|nr:hypothetical protein [Hydrogenophilus sp.]
MMKKAFAEVVCGFGKALGHLWATRGPEVFRAAREGRPEDIPVAPEDLGILRSHLGKLASFPSFEEVILDPEGREALYEAVALTVHPHLPPPLPLTIREKGGFMVWEHTTATGRGVLSVRYEPEGVGIEVQVHRPQGVALILRAEAHSWGLASWRLEEGPAKARPRHWAFLLGLLEGAGEKSDVLRDLSFALEGERWRFSSAAIEDELEKAAAAFRAAAEADWALREEAFHRLREAMKDAEEVLGMDLLSLRWALVRSA